MLDFFRFFQEMQVASKNQNEEIFNELVTDAYSELHEVAQLGNHQRLKELLENPTLDNKFFDKKNVASGQYYIDIQNEHSQTALHIATFFQHIECVKLLIEYKAKILVDGEGKTPLHLAAQKCNKEILALLTNYAPDHVNDQTKYGCTILHISIALNDTSLTQQILELKNIDIHKKNARGGTALHYAAESNPKIIRLLFLKKAPLVPDTYNYTPLHMAIKEGKVDCVEELLPHASVEDINTSNVVGDTALHMAAQANDHNSIRSLIDSGAKNKKNNHGLTPLHLSIQHGHIKCFKILLKKFPKVDEVDKDGNTSLHLAIIFDKPEFLAMMLALPNLPSRIFSIRNKKGMTPHYSAVSTKNFKCLSLLWQVYIDHTTVHVAAMYGDIQALEILRKLGANIHTEDENEIFPLHLAAYHGKGEFLKELLNLGVDVNAIGHEGNTALHAATMGGHFACVKVLLEHNAKLINNEFNKNALAIAEDEMKSAMSEEDKIKYQVCIRVITKYADKFKNDIPVIEDQKKVVEQPITSKTKKRSKKKNKSKAKEKSLVISPEAPKDESQSQELKTEQNQEPNSIEMHSENNISEIPTPVSDHVTNIFIPSAQETFSVLSKVEQEDESSWLTVDKKQNQKKNNQNESSINDKANLKQRDNQFSQHGFISVNHPVKNSAILPENNSKRKSWQPKFTKNWQMVTTSEPKHLPLEDTSAESDEFIPKTWDECNISASKFNKDTWDLYEFIKLKKSRFAVVGGKARDLILNAESDDVDIITDIDANELINQYPNNCEIKGCFPNQTLRLKLGETQFDIVFVLPASCDADFEMSLKNIFANYDFTINCAAVLFSDELDKRKMVGTKRFWNHINKGSICSVKPADVSIKEDVIRAFRARRFAQKISYLKEKFIDDVIDKKLWQAIISYAPLILKHYEYPLRLLEPMEKLFKSLGATEAIKFMFETKLLENIALSPVNLTTLFNKIVGTDYFAPARSKNNICTNLLEAAAIGDTPKLIEFLKENSNSESLLAEALDKACKNQHADCICILLLSGAKPKKLLEEFMIKNASSSQAIPLYPTSEGKIILHQRVFIR